MSDTDEDGWYYLIHMGGMDVVRCPGGWDTATEHLRYVRQWYTDVFRQSFGTDPDRVPWLIGAYPPWSIGGPEGKGGIRSFGYSPTWEGSIDLEPEEWMQIPHGY